MRELPFTLMPNTDFFIPLPGHAEALAQLQAHLEKNDGFLCLIGELGTGKTLLCKQLIRTLPETFETAYIPNPFFSPEGLIQAIADELGIDADVDQGFYYVQNLIRIRLKQLKKQRRHTVLLLDEAQAMPETTINALVAMAYLQDENEKLLQVILSGQPELIAVLDQKYLEPIRQRITFTFSLPALLPEQVTSYINQRVNRAGRAGGNLFTLEALKLISKTSRGRPGTVNLLCHEALLITFRENARRVSERHVRLAIRESARLQPASFLSTLQTYREQITSSLFIAGIIILSLLYLRT